MRTLLLLLLLLPSALFAQVKVLMPVVVKDAAGKAVIDLKESDFKLSGPKNVTIEHIWLIPPRTVSEQDNRTPVVVLYDAANMGNQYPEVTGQKLRDFLGMVAEHSPRVTFIVNSADGVHSIYDPGTPPEVLSAALALVENSKQVTNDPKVEQQAERIRSLSKLEEITSFRYDHAFNQTDSLTTLAQLVRSDKRTAVVWLTGHPLSDSTKYELMVEDLNSAHISLYPLWNPDLYDAKLAESTGGLSFSYYSFRGTIKVSSPWEAVQQVLADFGPYYMLAVAVPETKEKGWIDVKIKVQRPGLTVRAAPGFVALKPEKTH